MIDEKYNELFTEYMIGGLSLFRFKQKYIELMRNSPELSEIMLNNQFEELAYMYDIDEISDKQWKQFLKAYNELMKIEWDFFPKSKLENDKSGSTLCDNSKDYEVI